MSAKVLICGAGSIGARHIRNLQQLGASVELWRVRADRREEAQREFGITVHAELSAAIAACDAVVVATAPDSHMAIALEAARAGKALYIEKPLAHDRTGVAELETLVAKHGLVVEIGCQLRSHPNLIALAERLQRQADGPLYAIRAACGQRLDAWRPGTDYRQGFSADAARGGGALFELVHELDLIHWLGGPAASVSASLATVSDLEIAADDLAAVTLGLAGGALAQVEIDMVSPVYRRSMEIVCHDAVLLWDYVAGTLTRLAKDRTETLHSVGPGFERNELFMDAMRHFLTRLSDSSLPPRCALQDGIATLDLALAARRSHASGRRIEMSSVRDGR
jgi:predicted dehydrogenase